MSYGLYLSFTAKEDFLKAFRRLNESPYLFETFTPYAIEETFNKPLHPEMNFIKLAGLVGATIGLSTGLLMQWFADVVYSPMDIGGRPLNSWPAFIPVIWVLTVLFAGVSIFITLWAKLRLPSPYQSVFNAKAYRHDFGHFGILIHHHETLPTLPYLKTLGASHIEEVQK